MSLRPRIIGSGYAVPEKIRQNDDPIFDWIKTHYPAQNKLFEGYKTRRILDNPDHVTDIMTTAAQKAITASGVNPADIDFLIGTASISQLITPNGLSAVHKNLNLSASCWIVPVTNDFTNFASCLVFAESMIQTGRAKNVLICIGGNWSHNVDYHTLQALSAGDGAAAAVVSMSDDTTKWYLKDHNVLTNTDYLNGMFTDGYPLIAAEPIEFKGQTFYSGQDGKTVSLDYTDKFVDVKSPHYFQITEQGYQGFIDFGMQSAMQPVQDIMTNNNLTADDIVFIPHQTSSVLIDYWMTQFTTPVGQMLNTIELYGNVTVASGGLNLAHFGELNAFLRDNIVVLGLATDMHAAAVLLCRNE